MNNKKHIFFDLDHTLWDFEKNSALTFQQIFKEEALSIKLDSFLEVYVPINLVYWRKYRNDEISKENLRYFRLKEVFEKLNYDADDKLIHRVANRYINLLGKQQHLFKGCVELLTYLYPKYKLHIITNGFEEVQNNKLINTNIAKYFSTITTSEHVNAKKPNPKIFAYAINAAKALKEQSIMVGDNLEADIEGAIDFGIDAIFFGNNPTYKGVSINNLLELKKYL